MLKRHTVGSPKTRCRRLAVGGYGGCWILGKVWADGESGLWGRLYPGKDECSSCCLLTPENTGNYARRTDTITFLPEELKANFCWGARACWFLVSLLDQVVLAFPRERRLNLLDFAGHLLTQACFHE